MMDLFVTASISFLPITSSGLFMLAELDRPSTKGLSTAMAMMMATNRHVCRTGSAIVTSFLSVIIMMLITTSASATISNGRFLAMRPAGMTRSDESNTVRMISSNRNNDRSSSSFQVQDSTQQGGMNITSSDNNVVIDGCSLGLDPYQLPAYRVFHRNSLVQL
jgi:hypothetical protein